MFERIKSWWRRRSMAERALVGFGVPLVAVAALMGRARAAAETTDAAAENAEGGPGTLAVMPGVINAGATGVDTGGLAQLTEAFTGEISNLERRLDALANSRPGFGDSPTTGGQQALLQSCIAAMGNATEPAAARAACIAADGDPARARAILAAAKPKTPAPKPKTPAPVADDRNMVVPKQSVAAAIGRAFAASTGKFSAPTGARLQRLIDQVGRGRQLADITFELNEFQRKTAGTPNPIKVDPQNFDVS